MMNKRCTRCGSTNYRAIHKGTNYIIYCKECGKYIGRTTLGEIRKENIELMREITMSYLERLSNQAIDRMIFFDRNAENDKAAIAYAYYKGKRDAYEHLIRFMNGDDVK